MLVSSAMNIYELLLSRVRPPATATTATTWAIILSSGSRPTQAQLRTIIYPGIAFYSSEPRYLGTLITSVGGKCTLRMVGANPVPTELTSAGMRFNFSEVAARGPSIEDDAPTWGILYFDLRISTYNDFQGWNAVFFTVGDENSNADMKIQGGIIPKNSDWKPNDIAINFTGVV